jgi:hypothetical protein
MELSARERETIRQVNRKKDKVSKKFRKEYKKETGKQGKPKSGGFIKIDAADKEFSIAVRLRDRKCMRCGSLVEFNVLGIPKTHQASHYFGRGQESTRFDLENVDTLCYGCHIIWGSKDREDYRAFKIKQLGENRFNLLLLRSKTTCNKDRKFELLKAKQLVQKFLR